MRVSHVLKHKDPHDFSYAKTHMIYYFLEKEIVQRVPQRDSHTHQLATRCNTLQQGCALCLMSPSRHECIHNVCMLWVCNILQQPATRCDIMQQGCALCLMCPSRHECIQRHDAFRMYACSGSRTHCNSLQHAVTHCNSLQHVVTACNTLQHTATCMVRCTKASLSLYACIYIRCE